MRWLGFLLFAVVSFTPADYGHGSRGASVKADQTIPPVSVNIIESSVTVQVGRCFQFHFNVANSTYPTCTWTVNDLAEGNTVFGTITSEGLYTAPPRVPTPNIVIVKATATADPNKSDTATVSNDPGLTKAHAAAVVNLAGCRQFFGKTTVTAPETANPRNSSHLEESCVGKF